MLLPNVDNQPMLRALTVALVFAVCAVAHRPALAGEDADQPPEIIFVESGGFGVDISWWDRTQSEVGFDVSVTFEDDRGQRVGYVDLPSTARDTERTTIMPPYDSIALPPEGCFRETVTVAALVPGEPLARRHFTELCVRNGEVRLPQAPQYDLTDLVVVPVEPSSDDNFAFLSVRMMIPVLAGGMVVLLVGLALWRWDHSVSVSAPRDDDL
jgi:hypothetical protein